MASLRQINANRQNAQKSTGPVTDEGKDASRRNALQHGLTAVKVLPDDDIDLVEKRMAEMRPFYLLDTPEQEWIFEQMIVYYVRLDRFRYQSDAIRLNEMHRARLCWDDDRRAEAEELAAKLAKRPEQIYRRIARTKQGVELMIDRWRALGAILERHGEWTEAQTSMALDLLGTPRELRDPLDPIEDPATLVAFTINSLEARLQRSLDALDAFERDASERGIPIAASRAITTLRRYENACQRAFQWLNNQLRHRPRQTPAPQPEPAPTERTQWDSGQDEQESASESVPIPPQVAFHSLNFHSSAVSRQPSTVSHKPSAISHPQIR